VSAPEFASDFFKVGKRPVVLVAYIYAFSSSEKVAVCCEVNTIVVELQAGLTTSSLNLEELFKSKCRVLGF